MRNACLDAALAELEAVGIRDYQLARGGKLLRQDGLLEMNGTSPKPDPDLWRRQLEELIRRLNQMQVPEQVRAERGEIIAALRKLLDRTIQQKENGHGA